MPTERKSADMLDVLEILRTQHQEVDQLFEQLESGGGDRGAVFTELADKLAAHAAVEEQVFYPAVMHAKTEELLREAVEEHLAVKRVLADLLALDIEDDEDEFDAKIAVLEESFAHHAHEEEEGKLFPILEKLLDATERAGLGNEVLALYEQLLEQQPRQNVPDEIDHAAPLPPS